MSGTLKVGGKTLATHDTNTNVAKIQLGSTSDVVLTDSAGNNVLSESAGAVTLTANEANVGSNALVVDSSGNVGIGTSSPTQRLQVGRFTGRTFVVDQSGSNSTRLANDRAIILESGNGYDTTVRSAGTASFGNIKFSTNSTERMRIGSSGDIDVYGDIKNGRINSTYISGERSIIAYSGSVDNQTYIFGRNVADFSGVFRAEIGNNVKIILTAEGNGYFDGTGDLGAADYAEYFEWLDGNPNNDDRRGYPVVLESGKIRIATSSDNAEDIIGIISARPAIVGDTASLGWQGKFATDEFGERLKRPITVYSWTDANGNELQYRQDSIPEDVTVPDDANSDIRYEDFYSDEYDPTIEYVPRTERPEWSPVGLLGKLRMRTGQPTGTRWIKLRDISETIELWFIR